MAHETPRGQSDGGKGEGHNGIGSQRRDKSEPEGIMDGLVPRQSSGKGWTSSHVGGGRWQSDEGEAVQDG